MILIRLLLSPNARRGSAELRVSDWASRYRRAIRLRSASQRTNETGLVLLWAHQDVCAIRKGIKTGSSVQIGYHAPKV